MPNPKTDQQGFSTENTDKQRDEAAKGGPVTGPGIPDSKHGVATPYEADTQSQIAANSKKGKKEDDTAHTDKDHAEK